jgi:hypothetical protein
VLTDWQQPGEPDCCKNTDAAATSTGPMVVRRLTARHAADGLPEQRRWFRVQPIVIRCQHLEQPHGFCQNDYRSRNHSPLG